MKLFLQPTQPTYINILERKEVFRNEGADFLRMSRAKIQIKQIPIRGQDKQAYFEGVLCTKRINCLFSFILLLFLCVLG